MFYITELVLR